MIISDLIQKLQKIRSEIGDIPIYFVDDNGYMLPLSGVSHDKVDEIDAEDHEDLKVGQPIAYISS